MEDFDKIFNFDELIEPLKTEDIEEFYKKFKITKVKCNEMITLVETLNPLLYETYFGHEMFETEEDKKKHFIWCFDEVIMKLGKKRKYNKYKNVLYKYYSEYFYSPKIDLSQDMEHIEFFQDLMSFTLVKSKVELKLLYEIFK